MEDNEKKEKKIKTITIIIYSAFCLIGFPLIFIFHPRKFLFTENSESEEDKKYLFKNFVSDIYNNINKKLIDDITLTKQNEDCPSDYEVLNIEHQYYANFTDFFGHSKFCIKRNNDEEKTFSKILEMNKKSCESGQKPCGILNEKSKALLCINENDNCPLNFIDFIDTKYPKSSYFQIGDKNIYFTPQYNENNEDYLIIDIDLIYKFRICLERYHKLETPECEFYDNDICYIEDNICSKKQDTPVLDKDYKLFPNILSKNNIINDDNLMHNYCVNAGNKRFNIFSKRYVNFAKKELDNFLEEFPDSKQNNPLSDVLDLYKSDKNYENLFYYFSCILFIWSFLQLALLVLVFFVKIKDILDLANKLYLFNGLALFIFKLICFGILLVSQYSFYLKFKAVYLTLEDDPRDEILSSYKNLRIIFITKIFILWLVGFITICMELIILCFIKLFIQLQNDSISEPINKPIEKPRPSEPRIEPRQSEPRQSEPRIEPRQSEPRQSEPRIEQLPVPAIVHNSIQNNENLEGHEKKDNNQKEANNQSIYTNIEQENEQICNLPENSPPPSANKDIKLNNPFKKIELNFQLEELENESKIIKIQNYKIKVEPNETFSDIENRLRSLYSNDLAKKQLDLFLLDGNVINKNNTVGEYKIIQNATINIKQVIN